MEQQEESKTEETITTNSSLESLPIPPAPKMFDLVSQGLRFATTRFDLIGWYIFSVTAMIIVSSEPVMESKSIVVFFAFIASFVLTVYIALNTWTIIHAVSQKDVSKTTFSDSFGWAAKNFFPLIWTSILSGLAILFGFILFVIPGIALSVYLYFSIYAQVHGAKAGVGALKQSYRVVKGRWWQTLWQLLLLSLYVFILFIFAGLVYGVAFLFIEENLWALFVLDTFLVGVYGAMLGVVSVYSLAQYYKWLQRSKNTQEKG